MRFSSLVVAGSLFACAAVPPKSAIDQRVTLSEQLPPVGYVPVRQLSVQSGKGCGLLAERGSREAADRLLREAAEKAGATYVRITSRREPTANHLCLEHEYQVTGVAYRLGSTVAPPARALPPAAPPRLPEAAAATSPAVAPTLPHVLLDFENDATLGKPERSTERTSVALSLAPSESGGTALSITYHCQGGEPRALLNAWYELGRLDFRTAKTLSLRVKPDAPLSVRLSFRDGNQAVWTQQSGVLTPGAWQTITLKLDEFWRSPFGAPAGAPAQPVELGAVSALAVAPTDCADGHFLLDDVQLQ